MSVEKISLAKRLVGSDYVQTAQINLKRKEPTHPLCEPEVFTWIREDHRRWNKGIAAEVEIVKRGLLGDKTMILLYPIDPAGEQVDPHLGLRQCRVEFRYGLDAKASWATAEPPVGLLDRLGKAVKEVGKEIVVEAGKEAVLHAAGLSWLVLPADGPVSAAIDANKVNEYLKKLTETGVKR